MAHFLNPHLSPLINSLDPKALSLPPDSNVEVSPLARLLTIDFGRLHDGHKEESAKLFKAAKEDGIFYLNLQDPRFRGLLDDVDNIFAISKELFSLSEDEKMIYDVDELGELKLNG